MRWFRNLKVASKLMVVVAAVLVFTVVLGILSVQKLKTVNGAAVDMATNWLPSVAAVDEIDVAVETFRRFELRLVLVASKEDKESAEAGLSAALEDLQKAQSSYEPLISSPEEKSLYDQFRRDWGVYMTEHQKILELSRANKNREATDLIQGLSMKKFSSCTDFLAKDVALNRKGADDAAHVAQSNYESARVTIIVILLGAVVAGLALAQVVARALGKSIQRSVEALKAVEAGDVSQRLSVDSSDEAGQMAQALNNVAAVLQTLQKELGRLTEASKRGHLSERGKPEQFQGAYAEIVQGINAMLDAILLPIWEGNRILAQVSNGKIDELIAETYHGDHEKMKQAVNKVAVVLQGLQKELVRLADASKAGQLSERGKPDQFQGAYAEIVRGVNVMLDAILLPIGEGNRILAQISNGKLDELITQTYHGDHEKMKQAVNNVATVVNTLIADTDVLAKAAVGGNLSARADVSKHRGDYRKVVQGINETLDAVIKPVQEAGTVLERIAAGDLTAHVVGDYKNDHAAIKKDINKMAETLSSSMQSIGQNSQTLASSSEELSAVSQQMSSNAEETSAQAGVVAAAAEQVTKNLQTVATATEEMTASIKEIAKNATEAARVATGAVKIAENTNTTVAKLGQASNEIGQVIKVITSIAQQTNLLALNATIEAARAGEAGKGFAVVANEVKELAKETAKATEDITQKIEGIQADTKGAVEAIAQISQVIAQINDISNTIAGAVEEQTATTNEMARNVSEAAQGGRQVAENITSVATAAKNTSSGASDTLTASGELSRMAAELQRLVAQFKFEGAGTTSASVSTMKSRKAA